MAGVGLTWIFVATFEAVGGEKTWQARDFKMTKTSDDLP